MRHILFMSLGLTLIAATAQAGPRVWDQAWAAGASPEVHVTTGDAHVRVHAGPAGKVVAHVEYRLKKWGLVVGHAVPAVVFEHRNDEIWITLHDASTVVAFGGVEERYWVDVTVPPDVRLSVHTGDGSTDCDPLSGRFSFESGDGAVRAHGLKGDIEVSSGDGRVTLDDLEGNLRARTRDGHLSASGRFDSLDLGAGDGRVDALARAGSKLASTWSVQTGDGAVSLRIPHDLAALLDARTSDGHINVQLPITTQGRISGHELVGELNGGGRTLRIRTGDGSITLGLSD